MRYRETGECGGHCGYMTMLKTDSDGTDILSNCFGYGMNFVEGRASPCQGTSDFVNENCASEAAGRWKTSIPRKWNWWRVCGCSPPSDDASLGSADCNVVTNDEEFHFACPARVPGSELFFR